uniref:Uncharacterized protein n=1 Tax=Engystomops pustulosus TaxID=76066 RepID=A0AAV6YD06_ENGPU|nr:hypothetical protein GDO81_028571 [Engystomops pustulosus]
MAQLCHGFQPNGHVIPINPIPNLGCLSLISGVFCYWLPSIAANVLIFRPGVCLDPITVLCNLGPIIMNYVPVMGSYDIPLCLNLEGKTCSLWLLFIPH